MVARNDIDAPAAAPALGNVILSAAITLQRAYREHLVSRVVRVQRRRTAAANIQAKVRAHLAREGAAIRIQTAARPRLERWVAERREVQRKARQLHTHLERGATTQAAHAFAHRFDADGRDIDDNSPTETGERAMEAYFESVRAAAGLTK